MDTSRPSVGSAIAAVRATSPVSTPHVNVAERPRRVHFCRLTDATPDLVMGLAAAGQCEGAACEAVLRVTGGSLVPTQSHDRIRPDLVVFFERQHREMRKMAGELSCPR